MKERNRRRTRERLSLPQPREVDDSWEQEGEDDEDTRCGDRTPKKQKLQGLGNNLLSQVVYSFTFTPANAETSLFLAPSVIPHEIWIAHIVLHLSKDDKKALRATCRGFLFFISQLWKPQIAFKFLHEFLYFPSQMSPLWPVRLYGLYFIGTGTACDLQSLRQLHNLKEIDFDSYRQYLTDQDLNYLPSSLVKLDLSYCTQISDLGLHFLPSTLRGLDLSYCSRITDYGLQFLPTSLIELEFIMCHQISDSGIQVLPSALVNLKLSGCTMISDLGLRYLPSSLCTLNLWGCTRITNQGVEMLPPNLLDLDLCLCTKLTDECLPFLPSTLTELDIPFCGKISVEGLKQHLPTSLKHLTLSTYRFSAGTDLEQLRISNPSLRILFAL